MILRRPRQRLLLLTGIVLAAIALGVVLAGRGGDESAQPAVLEATCAVLTQASRHEPAKAKAIFVDQGHERLHELAGRASEDGHRAQAGRLLEAKNRVEASSVGPTVADAEQLVAATRLTLRAIGEPAGACRP